MNKYYIQVLDTVNRSPNVRMTITIFHGIHQNILQKVILTKSSSVAVLQDSPLLTSASFTFKIIAPPSLNPLNPFYYLQCKFIERNHKATLKQLAYLHVSLLKDNMLCKLRTWRTTGYMSYILHDYVLKLILGDIHFCYTVLLFLTHHNKGK